MFESLKLEPRGGREAKTHQEKLVRDIIPRSRLAEPFPGDAERDDDDA